MPVAPYGNLQMRETGPWNKLMDGALPARPETRNFLVPKGFKGV